jgi:hypothetical protein
MAGHSYETHIFNPFIGAKSICKSIFEISIMQVRGSCFVAVNMLINELDRHFVDFKLMNALNIVYPQF